MDHDQVTGYLAQQRNKRFGEKKKNHNGGYVSNFTNYDDIKSDSGQSMLGRSNKRVADLGLRKLLNDPFMNESERMNAVKIRTEQIENRAHMEEQKLRLMGPSGFGNLSTID